MKAKDLKSLSGQDLKSKMAELKKELIKYNSQVATGTMVKNSGQIREIKKTIARIMTLINKKIIETKDIKKSEAGLLSEKGRKKSPKKNEGG